MSDLSEAQRALLADVAAERVQHDPVSGRAVVSGVAFVTSTARALVRRGLVTTRGSRYILTAAGRSAADIRRTS